MTWLLWRQHRVPAAVAVALLAAFAVPVWLTGDHLSSALQACRADRSCGDISLFEHYHAINMIVDLTVAVPLLIGIFWGATLIGKELETGTTTLAWTQSITRRQWLRTKLLTLFLATAACSAAVTALVTWWSRTHNATAESRFDGLQFDIQGIAPIGYALFASALGLAAGVLWRRALPAMATTVAGFVAVRLVVELAVRWHYMSPATAYAPFAKNQFSPLGGWVQSTDLVRHGVVITGRVSVADCGGANSRSAMNACMQQLGYQMRTVYQPPGRYWSFQWIEFGIFAVLAALLAAVAVVALRRHDA